MTSFTMDWKANEDQRRADEEQERHDKAEYERAVDQYEKYRAAWDARQAAKVDQKAIEAISRLWAAANEQTRTEIARHVERLHCEPCDIDLDAEDDDPMPICPREPMKPRQQRALEAKRRVAPLITTEMARLGSKGVCMSQDRFDKHFGQLIDAADLDYAFDEYVGRDHRKNGQSYEYDGDRWRKSD